MAETELKIFLAYIILKMQIKIRVTELLMVIYTVNK